MEIKLNGFWQKAPYTAGTIQNRRSYSEIKIAISATEPSEEGLYLKTEEKYSFSCEAGQFFWFKGVDGSVIVVNFKEPDSRSGGGGSGGVTDYTALTSKPSINGQELIGDITSGDVVFHFLPFELFALESSATSQEISDIIGGETGWLALLEAAKKSKMIAFRQEGVGAENYLVAPYFQVQTNPDTNDGGLAMLFTLDKAEISFMLTYNAGVFVLTKTEIKLLTEADINPINTDLVAVKKNVDSLVQTGEIQPTTKIYINGTNTFGTTQPTGNINIPLTISRTPVSHFWDYTYTEEGLISPFSTYELDLYTDNVDSSSRVFDFSVKVSAFIDGVETVVSVATYSAVFALNNPMISIPISGNRLTIEGLKRKAGDKVRVTLTISREGGGSSDNILITSNPTNPSSFVRNGGEVSSNLVFDYNGTDVKSVSARLADIDTKIKQLFALIGP